MRKEGRRLERKEGNKEGRRRRERERERERGVKRPPAGAGEEPNPPDDPLASKPPPESPPKEPGTPLPNEIGAGSISERPNHRKTKRHTSQKSK